MKLDMTREQIVRLTAIAAIVIVLDQITKAVIMNTMPLYDSIRVIPGLFNITHIHNPGGAFGFLAGQSLLIRKLVFLVFSSIAVVFILYFYKTIPKSQPWLASGLAMIFGGAVGNLIDRFRFGKVVDFLDFYIKGSHWPAFNVADSAITVGVTIFIFHMLFKKIPE